MKKLTFLVFVLVITGCHSAGTGSQNNISYMSSIQKWHKARIERLKAQNGVLSVIGLFWLKEGTNSFGSDPSNDIVLLKDVSPDFIGSFTLHNGEVKIKVQPGIEVMHKGEVIDEMVLQSDMDNKLTILNMDNFHWFIIERNDEFGVRFCDSKNPRITQFQDIDMFKIDSAWRFEAHFEPYKMVKTVSSVTSSGAIRDYLSYGALKFKINNQTFRLDPIPLPNNDTYLLIFGDKTNGEETYSGGRFLYVTKPDKDSTTIIDFNKSINPPCAISEFFACPVPVPQNKLPFKVTAGEKRYEGLKH